MYNRYIRNDDGKYERIPVENTPPPHPPPYPPPNQNTQYENVHTNHERTAPPPPREQEKRGIFSSLLGKLKLDEIDTGDLLLLVILFLLFKDGDDEELLIALGLLLIL